MNKKPIHWFLHAPFKDVEDYAQVFDPNTHSPHEMESILFNTFLNPDHEIFLFWSDKYLHTIVQKNINIGHWTYAVLTSSPSQREQFFSLVKRLEPSTQKNILYGAIEMKDHELSYKLLELLDDDISPPHIIRHAVVNKNKKLALLFMKTHPQAILQAQDMILHSSYSNFHAYWFKLFAQHQKQVLKQELSDISAAKKSKTSKI